MIPHQNANVDVILILKIYVKKRMLSINKNITIVKMDLKNKTISDYMYGMMYYVHVKYLKQN